MCRPTPCKKCAKITWTGCGMHVDQVRASVPADQWCSGHPQSEDSSKRGLLRRILGR